MAVDVLVPPVGTNTDTLVLVAWHRREGERVEKDEPLFAVETDKSVLDIEAPASGILRNVTAAEGDSVSVLARVARIVPEGESEPAEAPESAPRSSAPVPPARSDAKAPATRTPAASPIVGPATKDRNRIFISPRAKTLALGEQLPWEGIDGSGPEGAIVEADILAVLEERAGRTLVEVLAVDARTAGGWWSASVDVDATRFAAVLATWRAAGLAIEPADLPMALMPRALAGAPRINATIEGTDVSVWREIRPAIGVETDQGIRWPVLRELEGRTPRLLAAARRALVDEVREGRAAPSRFRGATIAVMVAEPDGPDALSPVPPPGVGAALGVGRVRCGASGSPTMRLTLVVDARLAAVAPVQRALGAIASVLAEPLGGLG